MNFLLEQSGVIADSMDNYCQTPLLFAARSGHATIVMALLRKGALVDSQDARWRTPLSHAAEQGHKVGVRQLLTWGAQVKVGDKNGKTQVESEKYKGNGEVWLELMWVRFNILKIRL